MNTARTLKELLKTRKGIIFDFDGLLVDSEPFHYKAYNAAFEKFGHSIDPAEYWIEFTSKGGGPWGEIERHGLNGLDPQVIREEKFVSYSRFCQAGDIKFFPSAYKLVRAVKSSRLKLAIASGSRLPDILAVLQTNRFDNTFDLIMGKESAPREKPAPDIFLKTAEKLGINPADLLVLEDAEKGLKASKEAGIPCVIVRNRLNRNIEFKDADFVCQDLDEVIRALL